MQEYFIDTSEWTDFWNRWQDTVDNVPGLKGELLDRIGVRIQGEVHRAITASGLNDARGRVKRWQNPHKGTKNGYVAVRPDSIEVAAGYRHKQQLNAGALTNFLTSGHRIRLPSGRTKRYVPRIRADTLISGNKIPGRAFYQNAKAQATRIALQEAEAFLKELQL